ncbi:SAM-dependent methyltransferase [Hellea sp.]|nr:SAM-dependent methyltransferase [Hellea sp.]
MSKLSDDNLSIFLNDLREAVENGDFIRMVLGKPKETDAKKVIVTLFESKGTIKFSSDFRYAQKSVSKSSDLEGLLEFLKENLGITYLAATLFTNRADISFVVNKKGKPRMTRAKATQNATSSGEHNRRKDYLISPDTAYLRELGVSDKAGKVIPKMYGKFRQIAKFIEIVDHSITRDVLDLKRPLSVLDVGSGKGYLTFALYDYLSKKWGETVDVTGVDTKEDVVALCNKVAQSVGFNHLNFKYQNVESYASKNVDLLVALHACDTATDEALFQGIKHDAKLIFCAPCCQHEVSSQLRATETDNPLLQHGLFIEKQADLITDVARTLLLESRGYTVKIVEFVSSEHSMKNTLIVAEKSGVEVPAKLDEYLTLKSQFGFTEQRLEVLLGEI